jgi:hypothetical protein
MVAPPVAVLLASGLTETDVSPPKLWLDEDGLTVMLLSETSPDPEAVGLDETQALPPAV